MNETPDYWLALFNTATWQRFRQHGAQVAGFREGRWATVHRIRPGDYLLAYLTGLSRWVGLLCVTGEPYYDPTPLWDEALLPARVPVKPVVQLAPETAVPIRELGERLSLLREG
ncbi:MAG: EVE domain-containing protein, partial [Candidatus Competibacterales bacterium]|nr:EVE domain-containing protein [Candidatus Competibacterales bacterium]